MGSHQHTQKQREKLIEEVADKLPTVYRMVVAYHEAGHAVMCFRHESPIIDPGIRVDIESGSTHHKWIMLPIDMDLSPMPKGLRTTAKLVSIQTHIATVEICLAGRISARQFLYLRRAQNE